MLRRAAASVRSLREAPFVLKLDDGRLIEGVIDLMFEEDQHWIVVDFKTDADFDLFAEHYRGQVAWYVHAIEQIYQASAEGVLLRI